MAKLLVVEDDADIAELLSEVLDREGHSVRTGRNGAEGLTLMSADRPDVILCDVEMPVLDGPEMAHRILLHDAGAEKIPIVLISAMVGLRRVARRVGTPYYLAKPFTADEVLTLLNLALRQRVPPRPVVDSAGLADE